MAKLTNEQKIEIHQRRLKGETIASLVLSFNVYRSNIQYLIRLLDKHGYDILRNGKNRYYSKEIKEIAINRVLIKQESVTSVVLDFGLSSDGILNNWIKKYKENCYNVIEKPKGRPRTMTRKIKKNNNKSNNANLTLEEKIKELEMRNLRLEAENEYLKKLNALVQERELQEEKESE